MKWFVANEITLACSAIAVQQHLFSAKQPDHVWLVACVSDRLYFAASFDRNPPRTLGHTRILHNCCHRFCEHFRCLAMCVRRTATSQFALGKTTDTYLDRYCVLMSSASKVRVAARMCRGSQHGTWHKDDFSRPAHESQLKWLKRNSCFWLLGTRLILTLTHKKQKMCPHGSFVG